jgi:hypothetical protein
MSFGLMPSFSANSLTVEPSTRRAVLSVPTAPPFAPMLSDPAMRSSSVSAFGGCTKSRSKRPPRPLNPPRASPPPAGPPRPRAPARGRGLRASAGGV